MLTIFGSKWEESLNSCSHRMMIFCILFGKIFSEIDSKTFRFTPRCFDSCTFYFEFQFFSAFGETFLKIEEFTQFCTDWGKTKILTKGGKSKLKLKNSRLPQCAPTINAGNWHHYKNRNTGCFDFTFKGLKNWKGKVNMFFISPGKIKILKIQVKSVKWGTNLCLCFWSLLYH